MYRWALPILALLFLARPALAAESLRILAFGDSLTAGYGLPPEDAFPVQLEQALNKAGYQVTVTNAGVSGDTTADGRARIAWTLGAPFDYAIVELGANDMLRGLDPEQAYANLDFILNAMAEKHIKVLLAGMYAQRNLGADYAKQFDGIYARLIATHPDVQLYPFFLDAVVKHPEMFQGDGLHPGKEGVALIVQAILPSVEKRIGAPNAQAQR
ncbi:MAG TPA: arylesterase [Magnetospirillaceae bacterium]|jgi:acyl-CoA thioesterase-1